MKLKKIINILEKKFPVKLKEDWDNVGLIVGDSNSNIERVQISLDITDGVIDNAINNKVDLIISHHPFIFKSINKVNNETIEGTKLLKIIKNNINIYTLHTNLDSANGGLNDYIASIIGGSNLKILSPRKNSFYNLVIYIEESDVSNFNKFISILELSKKEYSHCIITDTDKINCNLKYGINVVNYKKIEIIVNENEINELLNEITKLKKNSSIFYEYSIYNTKNSDNGIGRYFVLDEPIMASEYIRYIKDKLNLLNVKWVYKEDKLIKKIAIINGSGSSYITLAKSKNIDLFITGDIKYHEALDAYEYGLHLLDIGHYESEVIFSDIIKNILEEENNIESVMVYSELPIFNYV
ncbi:MAG: Nif3-like dinuclear metal center hexameric protein [Fusobacteria bacterium]|nr:Nif3-like dinuclear metal center hexameric protein [Fusobacteriota bacterium]